MNLPKGHMSDPLPHGGPCWPAAGSLVEAYSEASGNFLLSMVILAPSSGDGQVLVHPLFTPHLAFTPAGNLRSISPERALFALYQHSLLAGRFHSPGLPPVSPIVAPPPQSLPSPGPRHQHPQCSTPMDVFAASLAEPLRLYAPWTDNFFHPATLVGSLPNGLVEVVFDSAASQPHAIKPEFLHLRCFYPPPHHHVMASPVDPRLVAHHPSIAPIPGRPLMFYGTGPGLAPQPEGMPPSMGVTPGWPACEEYFSPAAELTPSPAASPMGLPAVDPPAGRVASPMANHPTASSAAGQAGRPVASPAAGPAAGRPVTTRPIHGAKVPGKDQSTGPSRATPSPFKSPKHASGPFSTPPPPPSKSVTLLRRLDKGDLATGGPTSPKLKDLRSTSKAAGASTRGKSADAHSHPSMSAGAADAPSPKPGKSTMKAPHRKDHTGPKAGRDPVAPKDREDLPGVDGIPAGKEDPPSAKDRGDGGAYPVPASVVPASDCPETPSPGLDWSKVSDKKKNKKPKKKPASSQQLPTPLDDSSGTTSHPAPGSASDPPVASTLADDSTPGSGCTSSPGSGSGSAFSPRPPRVPSRSTTWILHPLATEHSSSEDILRLFAPFQGVTVDGISAQADGTRYSHVTLPPTVTLSRANRHLQSVQASSGSPPTMLHRRLAVLPASTTIT
ncbi:hypothetical protein H696_00901 [Fonticula alba]|uniref:Uncharacterized protein n=1 Tax=Fonticula alba TaxID=691883 RepID=A0A058ZIL4_FONAL|nr:hypothetical protein H696_00901 [Fonticula alba]KCV73362.1 hypothetical protein H696_00901 [Fonticula alba]|eukprot:XP_009493063.1 hypothetical protein H696_00901 [Fonticula alba]